MLSGPPFLFSATLFSQAGDTRSPLAAHVGDVRSANVPCPVPQGRCSFTPPCIRPTFVHSRVHSSHVSTDSRSPWYTDTQGVDSCPLPFQACPPAPSPVSARPSAVSAAPGSCPSRLPCPLAQTTPPISAGCAPGPQSAASTRTARRLLSEFR